MKSDSRVMVRVLWVVVLISVYDNGVGGSGRVWVDGRVVWVRR